MGRSRKLSSSSSDGKTNQRLAGYGNTVLLEDTNISADLSGTGRSIWSRFSKFVVPSADAETASLFYLVCHPLPRLNMSRFWIILTSARVPTLVQELIRLSLGEGWPGRVFEFDMRLLRWHLGAISFKFLSVARTAQHVVPIER
jgi:hypothetical protein